MKITSSSSSMMVMIVSIIISSLINLFVLLFYYNYSIIILLSTTTTLSTVQAYPMVGFRPQMRICIQSIDPNRLPSQCIYCKSRTFPLTVRMCTGNPYLPARMTLIEASCLVTTCRKQLPRLPPEPYSVRPINPMFSGAAGGGGVGGGGVSGFNNNFLNPMNDEQSMMNPHRKPPAGGTGAGSGHGGNHANSANNNLDMMDNEDGTNAFEDGSGPESLMQQQATKIRKPAKFFLGKPQKIQTSIRPLLFG